MVCAFEWWNKLFFFINDKFDRKIVIKINELHYTYTQSTHILTLMIPNRIWIDSSFRIQSCANQTWSNASYTFNSSVKKNAWVPLANYRSCVFLCDATTWSDRKFGKKKPTSYIIHNWYSILPGICRLIARIRVRTIVCHSNALPHIPYIRFIVSVFVTPCSMFFSGLFFLLSILKIEPIKPYVNAWRAQSNLLKFV